MKPVQITRVKPGEGRRQRREQLADDEPCYQSD
jgi:hypothetical protein